MWAQWSLAWHSVPGAPTFEQAKLALGPLLAYDVAAAHMLYRDIPSATAAQYIEVARAMCVLNANRCADLASALLHDDQTEEAVAAYETLFQKSRDRVLVANAIGWLVRYDYRHGKEARAIEIASDVAETYAARGLAAYADVLELSGRTDEAEDVYKAILQRYADDGEMLGAFHVLVATRPSGSVSLSWLPDASKV
jgi:tetratricopeptide (TPR) repeat protein